MKTKKREKRGRKPIRYNQSELERQPMIMIVCGETGVGKTYRNKLEIRNYMKDDPGKGKKGRKVLCFDTNDDDYPEYPSVSPDHIKALTRVAPRRIRPFNRDGSPMDKAGKHEVVDKILKHYRNGLLVFDDIDHYMTGAKGQSMIGALCTVRHKGLDIIFTHQSIAKITTTAWQNCTWLRLHHQVDDITRYRDRIPKYPLVRIAQLVVDEQYEEASRLYRRGKITREEYRIKKSYCVYVDMREQKLHGVDRHSFIRAAKKYIDREEGQQLSMMMRETNFSGKKVYQNRNQTLLALIERCLEWI